METNYPDSQIFEDRPLVYAGFWPRFAAAFIDGLILGVVNGIISYSFGFDNQLFSRIDGGFHYSLGENLPSVAIGWLYGALMESGPKQATLGKMALNIRVTDLNGGCISFGQATGRHFAKFISALILFIGYLMMLWDDRKQTLHDRIAGTLVLENNGPRA